MIKLNKGVKIVTHPSKAEQEDHASTTSTWLPIIRPPKECLQVLYTNADHFLTNFTIWKHI